MSEAPTTLSSYLEVQTAALRAFVRTTMALTEAQTLWAGNLQQMTPQWVERQREDAIANLEALSTHTAWLATQGLAVWIGNERGAPCQVFEYEFGLSGYIAHVFDSSTQNVRTLPFGVTSLPEVLPDPSYMQH